MNPNSRIKVLLLLGNHLLCKSLGRIIQQKRDIEVTERPLEISRVATLIARAETDVIVLDWVSANTLRRENVLRIRDLNPTAQILMIGMDADESTFLRAVRAGVRGYLLHEASGADVIDAIRAVARREAVCPAQFCRLLFDTVAGIHEFTPAVRKMGVRLTRRQQELLPMVARGMTNKEIASLLNLSEQTIKNHMHRILKKMGANNRFEALELVTAEDSAN